LSGMDVAAARKSSAAEKAEPGDAAGRPTTTAENLSWIYERYREDVFHLALRYGRGDVAWAEDLTQDVFVRLFRAPKMLHGQESLSGWFYRVTTNRCLNRLRGDALRQSAPLRWLFGHRQLYERTPEVIAMARDDLAQAFDAVNALPIKERLAFFMHHVDGNDQVEVARILGHSKGYVSKLLKRAEARLAAAGWKVDHGIG
jgi:RNA polymerase sigma-70 factor, ECF subfamily